MKKVLILAIGCQYEPWDKMLTTSLNTWDSIDVDGVETIFYSGRPLKDNTDKIIYFDIEEGYNNMGHKMIAAFEWALNNKEFDYIARVNSSCYVDKKQLIKYVQDLPEYNCFAAIKVYADPAWYWGGAQYVLSRDVIEGVVNNRADWNHDVMEDVGLSYMINGLGIPYTEGKACSINKRESDWLCIGYGGESIEFKDFNDLKRLNNHFYRVKCDADRSVDEIVMSELFKVL